MKIVIFGNSGAGKSTLAKAISQIHNIPHLDLDTVAWKDNPIPIREDIDITINKIQGFMASSKSWIIEGCYTSLLEIASQNCDELIFLNPGISTCVSNSRWRKWEIHKYKSKEEQDLNLKMLINWIKEYQNRNDEFSLQAHQKLFNSFSNSKIELKSNLEIQEYLQNIRLYKKTK